jgi:hypothetical protein
MSVRCIHFAEGYKYQLTRNHEEQLAYIRPPHDILTPWVDLYASGLLVLKFGYASDGSSGPTVQTKNTFRGSFVHDGLFQLIRLGLLGPDYFDPANRELHRILLEDGMSRIRAWWWLEGVQRFGKPFSDPANKTPDRCAPSDCADCATEAGPNNAANLA